MTHDPEAQNLMAELQRSVFDAISAPLGKPSPAAIERLRQELISQLERREDVVWARPDPEDPLQVFVSVKKSPKLVVNVKT